MRNHRDSKVIVIGVGDDFRSDDAVGLVVARRVAQMGLDGVLVVQLCGDITELLESWKDAEVVIVVDAAFSDGEPGAIYCVDDTKTATLDGLASVSTHSFGLGEVLRIAKAMDQLPSRLTIYGIEGKSFETGTVLSEEVARAVDEVVMRILEEVECTSTPWHGT